MSWQFDLTIHFCGDRQVSLEVKRRPETDDRFADILIFACLALRQLVNLGKSATGHELADILRRAAGSEREILLNGVGRRLSVSQFVGTPGSRRFDLAMTWNGSMPKFELHSRGFGFFDRRVESCALLSVLAFGNYLIQSHPDDAMFADCVGEVGRACAEYYVSSRLTVANQAVLAAEVALATKPFLEARGDASTDRREAVWRMLKEQGLTLQVSDLVQLSADQQPRIRLDDLDGATWRALQSLALAETESVSAILGAQCDSKTAFDEVFASLFFGMLVARRLLGTHNKRVTVAHTQDDPERTAHLMLRVHTDYPIEAAVDECGEVVSGFLAAVARDRAEKEPWAILADREGAAMSQFALLVSGFSLALVEAEIAISSHPIG